MYSIFKYRKGFTVVELMVALSLFAASVGLVAGVFVQALRTQRVVNNLIGVNSNGSIVMEQITREIRAGYDFRVGNNSLNSPCEDNPLQGVSASYDTLAFTRFRGSGTTTVVYAWNELKKSIDRQEGDGLLQPLTAENVGVERLCFVEDTLHSQAPSRLTILLSIGGTDPQLSQSNVVNLQTTVSARVLPEEVGF